MPHERVATVTSQLRRTWLVIVAVVGVVVAGSIVAALVARANDIPLHEISSDPAAVNDTPAYVGLLSFLTFATWAIAIGAALVGGAAARRQGSPLAGLLYQGAAITTWLLLDDMFEFHEVGIPGYLHVDEHVVLALYPVVVGLWLWVNRRALARTDWLLLVAAAFCFAASIGLDEIVTGLGTGPFSEDVPKLAGAALWAAWFVRTSSLATAPDEPLLPATASA